MGIDALEKTNVPYMGFGVAIYAMPTPRKVAP